MNVEIVSYSRFSEIAAAHPTVAVQVPETSKFLHEWESKRRQLIQVLSKFGRHDETGFTGGDFLVADNCFGTRKIPISLLNWKLLTEEVIRGLVNFLATAHPEYSIGISYDAPVADVEFFQLFLTRDYAILDVLEKDRSEAKLLCSSHPALSKLPLR